MTPSSGSVLKRWTESRSRAAPKTSPYISSVERCLRNVSIDNLDKMAKALKVRAAELLEE